MHVPRRPSHASVQPPALASIVDALGVHVYVATFGIDGSYRLLYDGPGADRLLGGPIEGDPAVAWDDAVHPDDRAHYDVSYAYEQLLGGEPIDMEYRLVGRDGVTRWVLDRCRPLPPAADGSILLEGVVFDVSERRRLSDDLADMRATFERVAQSIHEVFYTYEAYRDGSWRVLFATPGLERLLGLPEGEQWGPGMEERWDECVHPDDRERYETTAYTVFDGAHVDFEFRMIGADGQLRWMRARDRARSLEGESLLVDGVLTDVTAQKRLEEELERARSEAEHRSRTDELTGMFNRRHLGEVLESEVARAAREGTTPGVLLLDVDHFKRINDTLGHLVGDSVLVELTSRIRAVMRHYDVVARWGGEEFIVLAPNVPSDAVLRRIGQDLRRAVSDRPFVARGQAIDVTISVGAARGSGDVDRLVSAADRALYAAKRRGRDRVCLAGDADVGDHALGESDSVRLAQAVALASSVRASVRAGMPEPHDEQVAELSALTAATLGLDGPSIIRSRTAGWLHDVGKAALPDSVLAKPGPLDAEEEALMRSHSEIGEQLVAGIAGLESTAPIVRHHHERYDGSGYPDGLAGDAIPVEARIIAAAEAYAAMTAGRVYERSRSQEDAVKELRFRAGTQFDPSVVDALCHVLAREHRRAERRLTNDAAA